ncbi:uncharacterized protein LOC110847533 isoform X2 [Folsomia candida]|uniref:uncharacterized protein LOC110847533 isoform X2 n=1 Tax=Folsomia candida TaxID=158441 RepID=UPI001604B98C|nr:uncharacterized protein LOC110847533 isoform X2 [Folsomia candida]XP_035705335.1 uncharacterized protein LOC110847533 isoform X2 [Folsomia candida]
MVKLEDFQHDFIKPRRIISLRRLGFLILILVLGGYFVRTKFGNDPSSELEEEDSDKMAKRVAEIEKARKEEEEFQRDFRRSLTPNDSTELTMGPSRYKLFKKPRLHYKFAIKYCKRMDGKLAMVHKAENTRKLQQLVGKRDRKKEMEAYYGRSQDSVWVGRDKPKKKKKKKEDNPEEGGEPNYMDYMGGGMMGGGGRGEEMCPAISPHSVYAPSPCQSPLPFICEFDKKKARTPLPDGKEFRGRGYGYDRGGYEPDMDEMDREEPEPIPKDEL